MASNRTPTRFAGPGAAPNTAAEIYTVPANKIAVVKFVFFENTGGGFVYLGIGATTASSRIWLRQGLTGTEVESAWLYQVLTAGEELWWRSDDDFVIMTVDGDVYDV